MSNPLHDKGQHFLLIPGAGSRLERFIFENRLAVLIVLALLTLVLGYNAVNIKPDASFERLIPLEHPYIANMMERREDLQNLGNSIRVVVAVKEGDIFTPSYMESLKQIHDELFYITGVDRANMRSLWSPNVRWTEVTEDGFQGGTVIPDGYDGSEMAIDNLRQNILKSGEVGRLVADNFKSTSIDAPLYEVNPETGERLDYKEFSQALEEKVRNKFQAQDPNIQIHIVGFAKKVGDLIEGIAQIAMFFLAGILITGALLYAYSRCIAATLVPIFTSIVAVVWQLGILRILGFGLDPYSVLVPFLVFAIAISHGVQIVNAMAHQTSLGQSPLMAARLAFRTLYIAGLLALISDAMGFLTLLFIKIDVIRDLAVAASVGAAVVIITNLVLHPLIMSYIGISKSGVRHAQRQEQADRKWRLMSYFAHPSVAPISVLIAVLGFGIGTYYKKDLKIGDLDKGAPELRQDSRYNKDNEYVISNYSTSSDVLVVMVETGSEQCNAYEVMDAMDRLQWQLENTPGVQSTASLVTVSKLTTRALNEGNLKWFELSRNQQILNSSIQRAPSGMINTDCSLTPLLAFLEDHKAETLQRVVDEVEAFVAANPSDNYRFMLGAGNAGVEVATNQVIEKASNRMVLFVYAVVSGLCLLTFRSVRATLCLMIPLGLTSVLCEALMAQAGIGTKVATLPVIALGVGIGVDYGVYIYAQLERFLLQGKPLQEAYFETLRSTGKAVMFTGLTLAIGVGTWMFSPIKFQADMGFLLTFMFLWNMIGALWLLPALARFLLQPEKMIAKARAAETKLVTSGT